MAKLVKRWWAKDGSLYLSKKEACAAEGLIYLCPHCTGRGDIKGDPITQYNCQGQVILVGREDMPCDRCNSQGYVADDPDLCPTCQRPKATNFATLAAGHCPRWYAVRDAEAQADCDKHSPTAFLRQHQNVPPVDDPWVPIALEYHRLCEIYDVKLCGPTGIPGTSDERVRVNKHALATRKILTQGAVEDGLAPSLAAATAALQEAIHTVRQEGVSDGRQP